ncbi:MAG: Gfo/Idh/MocA family oxidoreductase [Gemmatimonadetes bacterium]|nr:Gfo/Idh/MocA family oxidoreductase [Gemmatimonadota bacterium]
MSALKVGVVGVGRLGSAHARILSEISDCQLVGVADSDTDRARQVAEHLSVEAFDAPALASRCDALVVAVTTSHHHAVTQQALESGCHVLVEKPLTPTLAEADDLVDTAQHLGLFLAVGHVERFNAAIREVEPLLKDPRYISSQRLATFQPRGTDVPVMLDLMIHDIDLVLGLVDSPVQSVDAIGIPVLTDSVDMASARLRFANGACADISASRVSAERTRALRLFQPSGYFSLDLAKGEGEYLRRRDGVELAGISLTREPANLSLADIVERVPIKGDSAEPLRLELEAFLARIGGKGSSSVSAAEGRAALEIALRIENEIKAGANVPVQDSPGT